MLLNMQLIGRLGQDAQKRDVNGRTVINFSIPYNDSYTNKTGQKVENTVWVECSWWTQSTGLLPYLTKGSTFYVDGMPSARSYVNKQGQTVNQLCLMVRNIRIVHVNRDEKQQQEAASSTPNTENKIPKGIDNPDDLPF